MKVMATHVNYCMKAQTFLRHRATKKVVGHFCTYDKNPECFSTIKHLCKIHESSELECTEVDVTLYAVCPHREDTIDIVFYADAEDSGYDSGYDGGSED
jgi:hypothetical protein